MSSNAEETTNDEPVATETTTTPAELDIFWTELNEKANLTGQKNLEKLIILDEYDYNGITYKAKKLTPKASGQLKKLMSEAASIDENKDWDAHTANIGKRACLLIEDMTLEKFEDSDFYVVENIVTAWGLKPRGFRNL